MEQSFKNCQSCGTENEPEYNFCKNCGAPLEAADASAQKQPSTYPGAAASACGNAQQAPFQPNGFRQNGYYQQPNSWQGYNQAPVYGYQSTLPPDCTVEGLPLDEISAFIGKNSDKYINKFVKIELTGSRLGWLWPPAILGFFFGPLGAALWLFYRKMPRLAAVFAAISVVFTSLQVSFLGTTLYDAILSNGYTEGYSSYTEDDAFSDDLPYFDYEDYSTQLEGSTLYTLFESIGNILRLLSAFFCGIMGYYLYKRHTVRSIYRLRARNVDQRYYRFALSSAGGTSGGWLAFGIIVPIVISSLLSVIIIAALAL